MSDLEENVIAYVNDNIFRLLNELRELEERTEKRRLQDLKNVEEKIGRAFNALRDMEANWEAKLSESLKNRVYTPNVKMLDYAQHGTFAAYSTCSAADFFHPRYAEICSMFGRAPVFHRKFWEWVYITHKLLDSGAVKEGSRGIAFGVGQEPLPALFASLGATIVATDAPPEIVRNAGWSQSNQHSASRDQLRHPGIIPDALFDERVQHRFCDMTAIDPDLKDFDFAWSSCSFEHLGSLEAGIQFVVDTVEKVLKVGGIACHTTEFNLSSDDDTVAEGGTVLYRRRDLLALIDRLRQRGHEVEPFLLAPDTHFLDYHVDVPPWRGSPHLKLRIGQYVATSVGIVARRGK